MKFSPCLISALVVLASAAHLSAQDSTALELFEKQIRPVLVEHCYQCHSALAKEVQGGLLVDSRDSLRRGGDSGAAVVPGNAEESLILAALRHESVAMPPDKQLPDDVIADFQKWIELGAPDPRDEAADPADRFRAAHREQFDQLRKWWSLQPVREPPVPHVRNQSWSSQPIDQFILAHLEARGLQPTGRADRRTLARRLSFALTGLPPAREQIEALLKDSSPQAWSTYVDRLLESPHFGERWARHWMDVVRYSDTYGYEWDIPAKGAWRYRDYLIRAFNEDVPFDQLVREHIAGDLLEQPRINTREQINESLIGTMFFQMGEKRHGDSAEFDGIHQEMLDNKIDAFSKAFQAQTIACARCHDHKLDPVLQNEYYALGGVFMSSRWVTNTIDTPERNSAVFQQLRDIKNELRGELAGLWLEELTKLPDVMSTAVTSPNTNDNRQKPWSELLAQGGPEVTLEDPRYAWVRAVRVSQQQGEVAAEWQAIAAQYASERERRIAQNQADFTLLADLRNELPAGWSLDGVGMRDRIACGDFPVALDGAAAIGRILPGGLFTHALSPRMNGALRSPYLNQFSKAFISFEYCGGDFSAHRTVIDNAFLTEKQVYLNSSPMSWLRVSTYPSMPQRRIYVELATKTSNPNFPPRVGLGGPCNEEQARDPRSWFGVSRILVHDKDAAPADELTHIAPLFDGNAPEDLRAVSARYVRVFAESIEAWRQNAATPEDVQRINWLLDQGQLTNHWDGMTRPKIAELVNGYRTAEKQLREPQTVNGMADLDAGYDIHLYVRGDYDQLGEVIHRGYSPALAGSELSFSSAGSGRRELAEMLASAQNPLTARVFVNRVWHWLYGQGIVATPNDFGHAGDLPSHPELLDYLAARFIAEGWSLKKLVREIVCTETWQQSSANSEASNMVDPENRLLHHYPLRRLEAEAIRDAMLMVSGRLDPQLYGPPIDPHRQNEDPQKRLFSGSIDGNGRRSIYTKLTIMEPPKLMALFNQPPPKISIGARDITTTPAQSLALLNDPFVLQQAERWATQLIGKTHQNVDERLCEMFDVALGRPPEPRELARWSASVSDFAELHQVDAKDVMTNLQIWTDVAHAMFNTKEFLYLQ